MILGIGVDILEKERVEKVFTKYPQAFVRLILHPDEKKLFERYTFKGRQIEFLAGRFAAKEAYMKATGLGMSAGFSSIAVLREPSGKPYIKAPHHNAKTTVAHVTISHNNTTAFAQVILEKRD